MASELEERGKWNEVEIGKCIFFISVYSVYSSST